MTDEATEDEIVRRVIRECHIGTVTECRLWPCQKANRCQAHEMEEAGDRMAHASEDVHTDPYPSRIAMEAAVELEIACCLGRVQTQTIRKVIQRAIDKAMAAQKQQLPEG